jgi:hypothetical protein
MPSGKETRMSEPPPLAEYLVISRGQWNESLSREEIEKVIDQFYRWLERLVDEGKMRRGQRLTYEGKTITQKNVITDGPFGESKEVIGGYWFVLASSLDEAAQIASGNPCLDCGLFFEVRPIDPKPANAENTPQAGKSA